MSRASTAPVLDPAPGSLPAAFQALDGVTRRELNIALVLVSLQILLCEAGAVVLLGDIARWTAGQLHDAEVWALAQIRANQRTPAGTRTSVLRPDHVVAATLNRQPARHAGSARRRKR
jgi:hypothetical protein